MLRLGWDWGREIESGTHAESTVPGAGEDDSWVGWDRLNGMAVKNEGEETLVVDVDDAERTTVTSWRVLFGRSWEPEAFCVVGEVEQSVGVEWHMDSEGCCWAERAGCDSCTGVGRSSSGPVEAHGRGEEGEAGGGEEDSGVKEYVMVSRVGGLWPVSMLLSLISTVIPL